MRGVDARADEVGEPQHRDRDVGAAAGEAAHVALDLDRVLGEAASAAARLGSMSSVNIAGSCGRGAVDRRSTTSRPACCTLGAFWQAASSCIVPMTLISFIAVRPPALPGVAMTLMCTTVSTSAAGDDLGDDRVADVGAHELGAGRGRAAGGTTSTPIDPLDGGVGAAAAAREPAAEVSGDPGDEHDAATAHRACGYFLLRRWTRVFLQQLAVLLLRHALAALLDDGTHGCPSSEVAQLPAQGRARPAYPATAGRPHRRGTRTGPARTAEGPTRTDRRTDDQAVSTNDSRR